MALKRGNLNVNDKRVLRKSEDRVIAGVCGGFAEYIGWPPNNVRILYPAFPAGERLGTR